MLIYNNTAEASNKINSHSKKKVKRTKNGKKKNNGNGYKSGVKRKSRVIRRKVLRHKGQKKPQAVNKKLLKKNVRFLKKLGLKVKK